MKLKMILLAGILLAILTIGAVGASEDTNLTSDELAVDEVEEVTPDPIDERCKPSYSFGHIPEVIYESDEPEIWFEFNDGDADGSFAVRVDDVEVANRTISDSLVSFEFEEYSDALKYNQPSNLSLLYSGNQHYLPLNITVPVTLKYIKYDDLNGLNVGVSTYANVELPEDASGDVSLYIDDRLYSRVNVEDGCASFWMENLVYGIHEYQFVYSGDDKYPSDRKSGRFNVSYILDAMFDREGPYLWGDDLNVEINAPTGRDYVTVNLNGDVKNVTLDEDGFATISLDNVKFGENTLILTYDGDLKYPKRSSAFTFKMIENVCYANEIRYLSGDGLSVRMPGDAQGNILVMNEENIYANESLKNGIINIPFSDLGMGHHDVVVSYTGDDYDMGVYDCHVCVIPNIRYATSVNVNEDNEITIELPDDAEGYFALRYGDELIGNESISNGKASIPLNNLPVQECLRLDALYTGERYGDFEISILINVRNESRDSPILMHVGDRVSLSADYDFSFELASHATGFVNVSVAGRSFSLEIDTGDARIFSQRMIEGLALGNYTMEVSYSGDDYYNPAYNMTSFELTYIVVYIPKNIEIGMTDMIRAYPAEDASGSLALYVDGKLYSGKFAADDECEYLCCDLSKLSYGRHDLEVRFTGDGKYPDFSQKERVDVSYWVDVITEETPYGVPLEVSIAIPLNINGNAILSVEGENYTVALKEGSGSVEVSGLGIGEHEITFTYPGDSRVPYKTANASVYISPKIIFDDACRLVNDNKITLMLPEDASGNLSVEIYDENEQELHFSKSMPLSDGAAAIQIPSLKLGSYWIRASYAGSDYDVDEVATTLSMIPLISDDNLELGGENEVVFQLPQDADGTLSVVVTNWDDDVLINESIPLVGGKASFSLKGYPADTYYATYSYRGDRYGSYENSADLVVSKHSPAVSLSIPKEIIAKDTSTLTFTLPADATGEICVEIADRAFYAKIKNGKASVAITPNEAGSQLITYSYEGNDIYEWVSNTTYINVLKTPTIKAKDLTMYYNDGTYFKASVLDSFGKPAAGKYVIFYIAGKKVKSVKTDSKGVAKLKITQLPKAYKITVKYRGASITKKLTVRQVLTLKAVKVKKSAKKLVLTATLKKGKKAIKYKYVKFYFNGKFIKKVKTNKYGIAKATVKKSALKKLKVGRKVTYQVTYVKDIVKKTAKVKK